MREFPRISVICIAYEVGPYLSQCLDSIINQTYENLEIILVVGTGGKDNCVEIAKDYAAKDIRIKTVFHKARGAAAARNIGLQAATGEYIGFVDGDDYIEKIMFEKLYLMVDLMDADIAVCGKYTEYVHESIPDKQQKVKVMDTKGAYKMILNGTGFFFHLWDKLFRASLFDEIVFPEDRRVEDRGIVTVLLSRANKIVYDSKPLYHFRQRSGSESRVTEIDELNTQADREFTDHVKALFPELKDECNAFLTYDHVTCLQNMLVHKRYTREKALPHLKYLKKHKNEIGENRMIGKKLRLKIFMAKYFRPGLYFITLRGVRKDAGHEKFSFSK
ncbi:MAG: glycosyltransferase [Lachnospiraceae bacterium]|nr:glycosyltransferase [Lachnospiraceae bacterium]